MYLINVVSNYPILRDLSVIYKSTRFEQMFQYDKV